MHRRECESAKVQIGKVHTEVGRPDAHHRSRIASNPTITPDPELAPQFNPAITPHTQLASHFVASKPVMRVPVDAVRAGTAPPALGRDSEPAARTVPERTRVLPVLVRRAGTPASRARAARSALGRSGANPSIQPCHRGVELGVVHIDIHPSRVHPRLEKRRSRAVLESRRAGIELGAGRRINADLSRTRRNKTLAGRKRRSVAVKRMHTRVGLGGKLVGKRGDIGWSAVRGSLALGLRWGLGVRGRVE